MSIQHQFRAMIESAGGGGAYVTVPFDVEQVFGKKRVKVKATLEGIPYRGSLVRMGTACHVLGVLKRIREKAGKAIGDEVEVVVEEDTEPRVLEIPAELQGALDANPAAGAIFKKLSYTHQRKYVRWIVEAKRPETRHGRVQKTIQMLLDGDQGR